MKVLKKISVFALSMIVCFQLFNTMSTKRYHDVTLSEVESNATCESIGWLDNDGNCVKNDYGTYFCKSDSWHEITDCIQ